MEELQQQMEEPVEEQGEERHPADTLNDGNPHMFLLFVPAFAVHTFIAAIICPIGVMLTSMILNIRPSYGRYFWPGFLMEFGFAGLMGYAWSKRLDRWLFGTSRAVWVIPALWLLVNVVSYRTDALALVSRLQHFLGQMNDLRTLHDQMYVVIPFACAVGYAVGAWYRRRRGEILYEKLESLTAEPQRR